MKAVVRKITRVEVTTEDGRLSPILKCDMEITEGEEPFNVSGVIMKLVEEGEPVVHIGDAFEIRRIEHQDTLVPIKEQ